MAEAPITEAHPPILRIQPAWTAIQIRRLTTILTGAHWFQQTKSTKPNPDCSFIKVLRFSFKLFLRLKYTYRFEEPPCGCKEVLLFPNPFLSRIDRKQISGEPTSRISLRFLKCNTDTRLRHRYQMYLSHIFLPQLRDSRLDKYTRL